MVIFFLPNCTKWHLRGGSGSFLHLIWNIFKIVVFYPKVIQGCACSRFLQPLQEIPLLATASLRHTFIPQDSMLAGNWWSHPDPAIPLLWKIPRRSEKLNWAWAAHCSSVSGLCHRPQLNQRGLLFPVHYRPAPQTGSNKALLRLAWKSACHSFQVVWEEQFVLKIVIVSLLTLKCSRDQ